MKPTANSVFVLVRWVSNLMTAAKKLYSALKRSHELENSFFKIQRIGNTLKVESKRVAGAYGEVYIDRTYLRKTFQVLRNTPCEEHDFCGLTAATLRSLRIGQTMTAILRKKEDCLRFEMIQGGKGLIELGSRKVEAEQLKALLELEVSALQLFDPEELRTPKQVNAPREITWAMEHPYGYVDK